MHSPCIACYQAKRTARFLKATTDKREYLADDWEFSGAHWIRTTDPRSICLLDKTTNMPAKTYVIVGYRVIVTKNTTLSTGVLIPNGAIGTCTAINSDGSVLVDIEKPRPLPAVRLTTQSSQIITSGRNCQLQRTQLPLELAAAQTIHGAQGETEPLIATSMAYHMWQKEMLFTLLTRVEKLNHIYIVAYMCLATQ